MKRCWTHARQQPGWLGLLVWIGLLGPALARGDALRVELQVQPDRLVLGGDQSAQVRLRVSGPGAESLTAAQLQLQVNVGRLDPPALQAPGRFTARYHPPTTGFPQVALISVLARVGTEHVASFGTLALFGVGIAQVQSLPYAKVQIEIDGQTFGPVRADGQGRAKIPIQVPPGVRFGTSKGTRIDLKLPEFDRLLMMSEEPSVPCDGGHVNRIWLFAIDERGRPSSGQTPRVRTERGRLGPLEPQCPGVWSSRYEPPAQPGSGRVQITAELADQTASRAGLELALVAGPPARLDLSATAEKFDAGSDRPIQLSARVGDANGNPVAAPIEFHADLGTIAPSRPAGPGQTSAELRLPNFFANHRAVTVTARVVGESGAGPQSQIQIRLYPGPAERLELESPPGSLTADGRTAVWLALEIHDSFGNPLSPENLAVSTQAGRAHVKANAQGQPGVNYTPPFLRQAGRDELRVTSGELSTRRRLQLSGVAYRLCLTPRVGYHTNFSRVHSPLFSLELAWRLPLDTTPLWLSLEGGYGFSNASDTALQADSNLSLVPLLFGLTYRRQVHNAVAVTGGLGLGLLLVTSRLAVEGQPALEQTAARFGLQVSLGAACVLGPGQVLLELRYLDGFGGSIANLTGRIGGLSVVAGYRIGLY